jgi:hypothetical protein
MPRNLRFSASNEHSPSLRSPVLLKQDGHVGQPMWLARASALLGEFFLGSARDVSSTTANYCTPKLIDWSDTAKGDLPSSAALWPQITVVVRALILMCIAWSQVFVWEFFIHTTTLRALFIYNTILSQWLVRLDPTSHYWLDWRYRWKLNTLCISSCNCNSILV